MSSITGKNIKISIFGQSHSKAIGVVIDGLPAGIKIDFEKLAMFMSRRAPGQMLSTQRKEGDEFIVLSGIVNDVTCGSSLCAVIENNDIKSKDYSSFKKIPRPGHSDYTALIKYGGFNDIRGGGQFSGRLTAPLCLAGGIAKQILNSKGIFIAAHLLSVGDVNDDSFDALNVNLSDFEVISKHELPVINEVALKKIKELVETIRGEKDSVGAVIECAAIGLPVGLGEPLFDSVESRLAGMLFSVPAVKGVEFGEGFNASRLKGSENNDAFTIAEGKVKTKTNHSGGILGGITNGMPLIFKTAFKPTPSIFKPQLTLDLETKQETVLKIEGRHDPCVAIRAVPVVEAAAALVLLDLYTDFVKERELLSKE